jgi:hypothetical protein
MPVVEPITEAELDAYRRMIANPSAAEEHLVELLAPFIAFIDARTEIATLAVRNGSRLFFGGREKDQTIETLRARVAELEAALGATAVPL